MATTVTVTCDRCGSIIPEVEGEGRRLIGTIGATLERSYESLQRSEWQLCASCFADVSEAIGNAAGVPSTDWRRPEEKPEPGSMTDDLADLIAGKVADRLGQPALKASVDPDPIAVAQRVLDGDGPEGEGELSSLPAGAF